ncbi:unnamed protein product [Musa acuminata subsp. burmannicoides]
MEQSNNSTFKFSTTLTVYEIGETPKKVFGYFSQFRHPIRVFEKDVGLIAIQTTGSIQGKSHNSKHQRNCHENGSDRINNRKSFFICLEISRTETKVGKTIQESTITVRSILVFVFARMVPLSLFRLWD